MASCLFKQGSRAQQQGILPTAGNELQADRQAVRMKARLQRYGRFATQIERVSPGIPSLTPTLGAEIHGIDLSKPLGKHQFKEVHDALMDN